jgi:acetyl-CoA carboxylase biotin carboxyl carrier protein
VEVKQINQLMLAMGRTGIKKMIIEEGGFKLHLEREEKAPMRTLEGIGENLEENPLRTDFEKQKLASTVESKGISSGAFGKVNDSSVFITSPMVGTCFLAPSPKDPPFVKVGDRIQKSTVVATIEAMKVMNEVKAGVVGIVSEILVSPGSPVEFGTKLIRITPLE